MVLLPQPKVIKKNEGNFYISYTTEIILDYSCDNKDLETARILKKEIENVSGFNIRINKAFEKSIGSIYLKRSQGDDEGYEMEINKDGITIVGYDNAGLFYGVQTLRQIVRQNPVDLPALLIEDSPYFKNRGFYHDVTRGKVPTLKTLKELVERLSFYKINQLQLYIEHTFAFKNLSEAWIGKDPLTAEEILELDEFCIKRNVELVPSLSTFGHLYEILRTKSYRHLNEFEDQINKPYMWCDRMMHHTLDVTNVESLELVKEMLHEFIPLFSSNKFNICCDETFDLGKGKSSKLNEKLETGRIYVDFLNKIINCAKVYDKEVMFWGDIILKHPEYIADIPQDVICLNWAYHDEVLEDDTRKIADSGVKQYVCPGVGGWNRLMNAMDSSFINISKMISYGKKYGAVGVLNTDWGDYGHVNLISNSMPGMIFGAALSWSPEDKRQFTEFDEAISILEFGKASTKLIETLRELSRYEIVTWSYIIWWKEHKFVDSAYVNQCVEKLENMEAEKIVEGFTGALALERSLMTFGANIYGNRKLDLLEFINSAKGVALMNAVGLAIKKYSFNCRTVHIVMENYKLAVELENWLSSYSDLWRKRNKESELYRIKETIIYICNFLRSIKK